MTVESETAETGVFFHLPSEVTSNRQHRFPLQTLTPTGLTAHSGRYLAAFSSFSLSGAHDLHKENQTGEVYYRRKVTKNTKQRLEDTVSP